MGVETLASKNTGTETNQPTGSSQSLTFGDTNPLIFSEMNSPFGNPYGDDIQTKNTGSETNQSKN